MPKYNLTLSQKQAEVLVRALDLYSRIGIGQFEEVLDVYDRELKLDYERRERFRVKLNQAKNEAGHPSNGSYGISSPEVRDEFRVSYDIQQVVRNKLALVRNPEGGITVDFDTPRAIGKEPLATISTSGS
jgi:hypothetical protein